MKDQIISWLVDYPEPVNVALIANLAAATLNFVVSCSMDNSSFFDQYWAMAPVPIALYYAFNETANWSIAGTRKILALVAVTVWAVRLFSLFFLRPERENDSGGKLAYGKQHEDSRYKKFREQSGIFYWPLSYVALHFFPALILHWGCLPLYYVLSNPTPSPTTPLDYAAFAFTIGAIILEATADQQLLDFTEKKITDPSLTFCNEGVWSWSRHPNYFGEFSFWLGLYLMGLAAVGREAAWTATGAVAVFGLFVGYSIPFMEDRMKRYPEWAEYVRSTSSFLPLPSIIKRV